MGLSDGNSRHWADYFVPKRLWLKELKAGARKKACEVSLAPEHAGAMLDSTQGRCPSTRSNAAVSELLHQAPDPRAKNTRFRVGPVLTITAMALLCGARQISEIARFANRLSPNQRAELQLPIKKGTPRFY